MKIDMHCHVAEGSVDSKVTVEEFIEGLQEKGIQGMVITDHNTYNGYRHWKENIKGKKYQDFVVLKGIEYDTRDAGHILVIMPPEVRMRLLELRGLPLSVLIDFVHRNGGILGPAHPCGEKYMSYTNAKSFYKAPELMKRFDFVEGFNACEPVLSNDGAMKLSDKYRKPSVGGSDAHRIACVGMGYTEFEVDILTELDLIEQIRKHENISCGGEIYDRTTKDKLGKASFVLTQAFGVYNVSGAFAKKFKRKTKGFIENPVSAIDPIEIEYLKKRRRKREKIK